MGEVGAVGGRQSGGKISCSISFILRDVPLPLSLLPCTCTPTQDAVILHRAAVKKYLALTGKVAFGSLTVLMVCDDKYTMLFLVCDGCSCLHTEIY